MGFDLEVYTLQKLLCWSLVLGVGMTMVIVYITVEPHWYHIKAWLKRHRR